MFITTNQADIVVIVDVVGFLTVLVDLFCTVYQSSYWPRHWTLKTTKKHYRVKRVYFSSALTDLFPVLHVGRHNAELGCHIYCPPALTVLTQLFPLFGGCHPIYGQSVSQVTVYSALTRDPGQRGLGMRHSFYQLFEKQGIQIYLCIGVYVQGCTFAVLYCQFRS